VVFMIYTPSRMIKHVYKGSLCSAGIVRPLFLIDACMFDFPCVCDPGKQASRLQSLAEYELLLICGYLSREQLKMATKFFTEFLRYDSFQVLQTWISPFKWSKDEWMESC